MTQQAYISVSKVAQQLQRKIHGLSNRQAREMVYYQIKHAVNPVIDQNNDVKKICGRLFITATAADRLLQGELA